MTKRKFEEIEKKETGITISPIFLNKIDGMYFTHKSDNNLIRHRCYKDNKGNYYTKHFDKISVNKYIKNYH